MTHFEDRSDGGICITDNHIRINLASNEAYALWQWLSMRKDSFQAHSSKKQLEIHLYQQDLSHFDELKATIADLHERGPIMKILDARWETVSERALQLLKDYQIEYHIHPSLEEDNSYAQG
ncbi:MAG: hypothetical protein NVS4B12_06910 [Ktedonobacteraceae bacterium]